MGYTYSEKDFIKLSWEDIEKYINGICSEITDFIRENNLKIRFIVPVIRGGAIPAVLLSHKLRVTDFLPAQVKVSHRLSKVEIKVDLRDIKAPALNNGECVLIVEGNHVTGGSASIVKDMAVDKFGKETKIIYVSISKDYSYKDSVGGVVYSTCGLYTNETKKLSRDECVQLNIDYEKITLFPWETVEGELKEING